MGFAVNLSQMSKLIYHDEVSGFLRVWFMQGLTKVGEAPLHAQPRSAAQWKMSAVGDFDGDLRLEVVWRQLTGAGAIETWTVEGLVAEPGVTLGYLPDQNWHVSSASDMNLDGTWDLVVRNVSFGENQVWLVSGGAVYSQANLPPEPDTGWRIVAAVDLTRDYWPDLWWWKPSTGEQKYWYLTWMYHVGGMSGNTVPVWQMPAFGDIDNDGDGDIFWWRPTTSSTAVALIDSSQSEYGLGVSVPMLGTDCPSADRCLTGWRLVGYLWR
jgi:hypothetical protein